MSVRLFDEHPDAAAEVRARVPRVHGRRVPGREPAAAGAARAVARRSASELCVVGDDYQTIYSFTGASPEYLLEFPERLSGRPRSCGSRRTTGRPRRCSRSRTRSHRSSAASRSSSVQRSPTAPNPTGRALRRRRRRGRVRRRPRSGACTTRARRGRRSRSCTGSTPAPSRTRRRSPTRAIPYQVRDGAFLRRPGPRSVLAALRRPESVDRRWRSSGHERRRLRPGGRPRETTRRSRARPTSGGCARSPPSTRRAHPEATWPGSSRSSSARFATEQSGRGVNLLTYHRAKGLEFDAVFLPRLLDGSCPFRSQTLDGRSRGGAPAVLRRHHAGAHAPVPLVAARGALGAQPVPP